MRTIYVDHPRWMTDEERAKLIARIRQRVSEVRLSDYFSAETIVNEIQEQYPAQAEAADQRVSLMQLQIQQIMAEKQASKERGEFPVIIPRRDKFPDEFKKALAETQGEDTPRTRLGTTPEKLETPGLSNGVIKAMTEPETEAEEVERNLLKQKLNQRVSVMPKEHILALLQSSTDK